MDRDIRGAVWERAGGRCEITGAPLGHWDADTWECHHRRNKGMGGTSRVNVDDYSNLIALTPRIHNGGPHSVHGSRLWAELYGYLLPKHIDDPSQWPLYLRGRDWVLLTGSGVYAPLPPEIVKGLPR